MPFANPNENEKPRGRLLSYVIRTFGVVVGLGFIFGGSAAVIANSPFQPRHVLMLLNFIVLGLLFIRYGITGRERVGFPRPTLAVWLLSIVGALLVGIGFYSVLFDGTASTIAKVVLFICGLVGLRLLLHAVRLRKHLRAQNQ